jgi:hypothetical protein
VRSSGYLSTATLGIWVQYSFYVVGSETPRQGYLIQQGLFVDSSREAALKGDILHLSDTLHNGFNAATQIRGS